MLGIDIRANIVEIMLIDVILQGKKVRIKTIVNDAVTEKFITSCNCISDNDYYGRFLWIRYRFGNHKLKLKLPLTRSFAAFTIGWLLGSA